MSGRKVINIEGKFLQARFENSEELSIEIKDGVENGIREM